MTDHDRQISAAAALAEMRHAGQMRKGTDRPYITHPRAVAMILADHYPNDTGLICAGFLHDVLEDTAATAQEIEDAFGPVVRALVERVTKHRGVPWSLAGASPEVHRLKAADALHNVLDTIADLAIAPDLWTRFKGGRTRKIAYYEGLADTVAAVLGRERLALDLRAAVVRLARS